MVGLFKDRIIREKAGVFSVPELDKKIALVKKWHDAYHDTTSGNGLKTKNETQCEQAFNHDFFVEILGYRTYPGDVYTIEPKATTEATAQKPDSALGYFTASQSRVIAVVEIKDAKTPLDRSQKREGNLSPIQQAFKYKPQFKDCEFVIATNFYETRLFKDNQLDYERFTLDELVDEKDGYFNFRKFYYLLCAENFIRESGKTETSNLLSEIRIEQENITKKFYEHYRTLRHELIQDIVRNNNETVKRNTFYNLAVEKAQKIIDRVVLICFFEDRGLLPEHKLKEVVSYAEMGGVETPVWDTMKKFFSAIDKGSLKLEIPEGYNGELFKPDQELDQLVVGDDICRKFVELGKYDFKEDLSVNILGHIFEQSISDLEALRNFAEHKDEQEVKKDSRRKKDGIFYTPDYIVDYIVKNSLGKYLEEQEQKILGKWRLKEHLTDDTYDNRLLPAYREYKQSLFDVKVLDPACGSGAFLVRAFDYLCDEHERVADAMAALGDTSDLFDMYLKKQILEHNIFGVDLNKESVEITKLSLWLKSARKGEKLTSLSGNIKCGNSLIDDPAIAGERAFDWNNEFSEIMVNGGFDVVVGNPPYVFAREKISQSEKDYYVSRYCSAEYQVNTYLLFIEKSIALLKDAGTYCLIIPNAWLMVYSAQGLRRHILESSIVNQILNLEGYSFDGVSVETIIMLAQKQKAIEHTLQVFLNDGKEFILSHYINQADFAQNAGSEFKVFSNDESSDLTKKLKKDSADLDSLVQIKAGLKAYEKGKGNPKQTAEDVTNRPYDFKTPIDGNTHKYLDGKNVGRYVICWSGEYLQYGDNLAAPRSFDLFNGEKLIIREITGKYPKSILATYSEDLYLYNMSNIGILKREEKNISLKYILAILNSSLISYYFLKNTAKSVRKMFPKIILNDLRIFPIKEIKDTAQKPFIEKVDLMLQVNKEFNEKLQHHLTIFRSHLEIDKLPTKIEKFYELSFEDFVKATKMKIPLSKKSELLEYFEKAKLELKGIKANIDATDREINTLVYKLYDLTDEEIALVEAS